MKERNDKNANLWLQLFRKGKFESTQMQNLCTFCYQQNLKLQFVFTISHIVSLHWRNKDNFQNLISKNSFSLYDWTEIFILAYTNITFSLYTYYNLVDFSAILSGYDHFSRERREKGIDISSLVFFRSIKGSLFTCKGMLYDEAKFAKLPTMSQWKFSIKRFLSNAYALKT